MNTQDIPNEDRIRILNELALTMSKKLVNSQTGYIHYYYNSVDDFDVTIPVYENFLYAYALLKTRTIENITEAKRLFSALLCFQNKEFGNFPLYLHEYPECFDDRLSIKLLPIFVFTLKQYRLVLGEELLQSIKSSLQLLFKHAANSLHFLSFTEKLLFYSSALASQVEIYKSESEKFLSSITTEDFENISFFPKKMGEALTAIQIYPEFAKKIDHSLFTKFYSSTLCSYVGPGLHSLQEAFQPATTLYDLHLAAMTGHFPERIFKNSTMQLYASLIQPYGVLSVLSDDIVCLTGNFQKASWTFFKNLSYVMNSIDIPLNKEDPRWKNIVPFSILWGNLSKIHQLVLQGGNYQTIKTTIDGNVARVILKLAENSELEDKEKKNEVILCLNKDADTKIFVESEKATTFSMDQTVSIHSCGLTLKINFRLIDGDGVFFGHLMPGNRVSQVANMGKNKYMAYDTQILLRTLRRSEATIEIKIEIDG